MLDNPAEVLVKSLRFAGLEPDQDKVQRAVDRSSFKAMQAVEAAEHDEYFSRIGGARSDIRFVREGRKGGWADHFSGPDLEFFEPLHGPMLHRLGYG